MIDDRYCFDDFWFEEVFTIYYVEKKNRFGCPVFTKTILYQNEFLRF